MISKMFYLRSLLIVSSINVLITLVDANLNTVQIPTQSLASTHSTIYIPNTPVLNSALEESLQHSLTDETHMHGPSSEMAGVLIVMGEILLRHGEYEDAYKVYEELLHLQESNSSEDSTLAVTLASIGHVKQAMGDFDGAFYAFSEILDLDDISDEDIADTLFAMGLVLLEGEHYNEALQIMHDAVEAHSDLSSEIKDTAFIAGTLDYVGEIYIRINRLDDAINTWMESSSLWRNLGDNHRLADTLNSVGVAYFRSGDLMGASRIYEEAISLYQQAPITNEVSLRLAVKNYELTKEGKTHITKPSKLLNTHEEGTEMTCIASFFLNGKVNETGEHHC